MNRKFKRAKEQSRTSVLLMFALAIYVQIAFGTIPQAIATEQADDIAIGIVIDILRSDEHQMHEVAVVMTREMPGEDVTKALAKELPNLPELTQIQLLSALAERGDRAALPAVIKAIKADDQSVRIAALKALGQLGDASNVILLAQTAGSTSGAEQKVARDSLYLLRGQDIDGTILGSIAKAESKTKAELIRSIAKRNIHSGVESLLKTTQDPERSVRLESFKTLRAIASEDHLSDLIDLLLNAQSQSERREAENTIAAIARKINDSCRQTEAILAALSDVNDVTNRCSLLNVLGRIGNDNSLGVLTAALKDEDAKVKDTSIRALSDWPNPVPINELLKIAQDSENKTHRILALRGLIRLVELDSDRPAEETICLYKQAMSLATNVPLKRRVLSGLANVKSFAAFEITAGYLEDEALSREAEFAVVEIAEAIAGDEHTEQIKAVLQKIIQATKNDSVREKANEVLKNFESTGPG